MTFTRIYKRIYVYIDSLMTYIVKWFYQFCSEMGLVAIWPHTFWCLVILAYYFSVSSSIIDEPDWMRPGARRVTNPSSAVRLEVCARAKLTHECILS